MWHSAPRRKASSPFVRQAAIIGTAGLVMGTALAVLVAEALSGVLFGIDPLAVMPIVLTAATLIVVVLLAGRPGSTRVEGRAARRTQKLIGCAFSVTSHSGFVRAPHTRPRHRHRPATMIRARSATRGAASRRLRQSAVRRSPVP